MRMGLPQSATFKKIRPNILTEPAGDATKDFLFYRWQAYQICQRKGASYWISGPIRTVSFTATDQRPNSEEFLIQSSVITCNKSPVRWVFVFCFLFFPFGVELPRLKKRRKSSKDIHANIIDHFLAHCSGLWECDDFYSL